MWKNWYRKLGVFLVSGGMLLGGLSVPKTYVSATEYEQTAPEEAVIEELSEDVAEDEASELLGASASYNESYAFEVLKLMNQERTSRGLTPLKMDVDLYNTAKVRAAEISTNGNFSHTRPNGSECWTAFPSVQTGKGENIAAGYESPSKVMTGWMNSSGHKANILNSRFKGVGVACYYVPGSTYGYYWTQCFGSTVVSIKTEGGGSVSVEPPTTEPVATNNATTAAVAYKTHVQTVGWQNPVLNGATSGSIGASKRLEGIRIAVASATDDLGVRYKTHVQSHGWQGWVENGEMSGTEGESKRLEAIAIELTGSDASRYDVYYRVHAQSYGWLGWAKNGQYAGTAGQGKRLEAIQIMILDKGRVPNNGSVGYSYVELGKSAKNTNMSGMVNYMTHVQSYGDQSYVYDGSISGTTGEAKRLEGIRINLNNSLTGVSGGITYSTHVQKYGWLDWESDGEFCGTHGEAKRLEAIKIKLTGNMAQQYDVYYRVHAQSYGWLGWAKNGEPSGTAGYAKRLEGIQIVLVPKGGAAPSSTMQQQSRAYIAK